MEASHTLFDCFQVYTLSKAYQAFSANPRAIEVVQCFMRSSQIT